MRGYEKTHPWIDFRATDINRVEQRQWMLLGEAKSKCEHLAGAPLQPAVATELYRVTLIKGALATTAIEGNTLSEEQAAGILDGTYEAPPSRRYQQQEVQNVLEALDQIQESIRAGDSASLEITFDRVCEFNRQVLKDLEVDEDTVPGEIRLHRVAVGSYRGAPAEDCEFLVKRLVEWLNDPIFRSEDPELHFALSVAKAVYAHLYMAWIHPFGDGNGRTARLLEFLILASCGMVPVPAAHLLSNHYNLTRDRYYAELAKASKTRDTLSFLVYAIEGFIDGIRETISMVRDQQIRVAWINYVHERFAGQPNTEAMDRQRSLVLAMTLDESIPRTELTGLTRKLATLYAGAGPRMLSRDLNHLESMGLIRRDGKSYVASSAIVRAFLPPMADPPGNHS